MVLTFATVEARVLGVVQNQPANFNIRAVPFIGRHFSNRLARENIFSTRDLARVCAARADPPPHNMADTLAARLQAKARLHEFLASVAEGPRGARCVGSFYDRPPPPDPARRTYLVRDLNPGAFWALVALLKNLWPNPPNAQARRAAVVALTGGAAQHLRRGDIEVLRLSVTKPRALGARSNAAAATCVCRRTAAACGAAQLGGNALCQWLAHGQAAQGLPNWPAALAAGVCLPHPNLNVGSAEPFPGRTRGVEAAPYPAPGQPVEAALVGPGGGVALATYTRRNNRQFRRPLP